MRLANSLNVDSKSIALLGSGAGGSDLVFLAAAHHQRRQSVTNLPPIRLLIASSSTGGLPGTLSTSTSEDKGKSKQSDSPKIFTSSDPDFSKEIAESIFTTTEMNLMMEGNEWGQWKSLSLIDPEVRAKLPNTFMIIPGCDDSKDTALNLLSVLQESRIKTRSLVSTR